MSAPKRKKPSVVVLKKKRFSIAYKRVFDDATEAYDTYKGLLEEYNLEEYNIVLTLVGAFDIFKYLDMISDSEIHYVN